MLELTSVDRVSVKGFDLDMWTFEGVPGLNPRNIVGDHVVVDGKQYVVRRAETYAVIDPTGMNFGLMLFPCDFCGALNRV